MKLKWQKRKNVHGDREYFAKLNWRPYHDEYMITGCSGCFRISTVWNDAMSRDVNELCSYRRFKTLKSAKIVAQLIENG